MQTKDQFIARLGPYKPIQPSAVRKLFADTDRADLRELYLALQAMGTPIPADVIVEPLLTLQRLIEFCDIEGEQGQTAVYIPKRKFMMAFDEPSETRNGLSVIRHTICYFNLMDGGRVNLTLAGYGVANRTIRDTDDEFQRIHVFKLVC